MIIDNMVILNINVMLVVNQRSKQVSCLILRIFRNLFIWCGDRFTSQVNLVINSKGSITGTLALDARNGLTRESGIFEKGHSFSKWSGRTTSNDIVAFKQFLYRLVNTTSCLRSFETYPGGNWNTVKHWTLSVTTYRSFYFLWTSRKFSI